MYPIHWDRVRKQLSVRSSLRASPLPPLLPYSALVRGDCLRRHTVSGMQQGCANRSQVQPRQWSIPHTLPPAFPALMNTLWRHSFPSRLLPRTQVDSNSAVVLGIKLRTVISDITLFHLKCSSETIMSAGIGSGYIYPRDLNRVNSWSVTSLCS